jgi:hypothetical protein
MASAKLAAAMQVLLTSDLSSLSSEDVKSLMEHTRKDLKSRGVNSRPTSSRKSHEQRADAPFDPNMCHARQHVLATHPGTKVPLFQTRNKSLHVGLLNVQCNCKPSDGGNLCKKHANMDIGAGSDASRCYKTGELYLGLYNEEKPENPTRDAPPGKSYTTRKYVWLDNVTDEHDQYKTDPPDQDSTSPAKKSKKTPKQDSDENYDDFNWKIAVNSGDIKSFKVPRLKLYLQHHDISLREDEDQHGNKGKMHGKKKLIEIITDHLNHQDHTQAPQAPQAPPPLVPRPQAPHDQSQDENTQQHTDHDHEQARNGSFDVTHYGYTPEELEEMQQDDQDIDENEHGDTIVVDGVTYDLDEGQFYDSETSLNMGKIDPSKPKGVAFNKSALKVHGQNIALLMANE